MKNIVCQDCGTIVGTIQEDALVCSCDQFMGIDICCKKCKSKLINEYYSDENQLIKRLKS